MMNKLGSRVVVEFKAVHTKLKFPVLICTVGPKRKVNVQIQFSMIRLVLDHVLIPNFQVQLGARLVEGKKCPENLTFTK